MIFWKGKPIEILKKKKKKKSVVVRGLGSGGDWKGKVKLLEHRVYVGL